MSKKMLVVLILLSVVFIYGCEGVDVSKISDKDLARLSEKRRKL